MKHLSTVLLMSEVGGKQAYDLATRAGIEMDITIVNDLGSLSCAFSAPKDLLLSFETGVIVPVWILQVSGLMAINVHAASPAYPGRDPHHFAVYDGAKRYGATMHYMTKSVDAGPIIDTELFDVKSNTTPSELMNLANEAGWKLISRFFNRYRECGTPVPINDVAWGTRKSTRKMFLDLCRIDPSMSKEEIVRRYKATAMPGYRNLYVDIHGYRFRIETLEE